MDPHIRSIYLDGLEENVGQAIIQERLHYFRTIHTNRSPSFENMNSFINPSIVRIQ